MDAYEGADADADADAPHVKRFAEVQLVILAAFLSVFVLSWSLTLSIGFAPLDATHTRFSQQLCIVQVPPHDCFVVGDVYNATAMPQKNIVCGCSQLQTSSACPSGLASWFIYPDRGQTLTSTNCTFPPEGLWITGLVVTCTAVVAIAYAWIVVCCLPPRNCLCQRLAGPFRTWIGCCAACVRAQNVD